MSQPFLIESAIESDTSVGASRLVAFERFGPGVREGLAVLPGRNFFVRTESFLQSGGEGFAGRFQSDQREFVVAIAEDRVHGCKLGLQMFYFFGKQGSVSVVNALGAPVTGKLEGNLTARLLPKQHVSGPGREPQETLGSVKPRDQLASASFM